jgi:hypothetical protein
MSASVAGLDGLGMREVQAMQLPRSSATSTNVGLWRIGWLDAAPQTTGLLELRHAHRTFLRTGLVGNSYQFFISIRQLGNATTLTY